MFDEHKSKRARVEEEPDSVVILDCGAQYGKVIDRRVRELCVYSDILPLDTDPAKLSKYKAIIISGGPQSVYGAEAPKYNKGIFDLGLPIFGICYGMQLLVHVNSGSIHKKTVREDGQFFIDLEESCPLFKGLGERTEVLLTHGDSIQEPLPEGFKVAARSVSGIVAAISNQDRQQYGVQFHPEVDLTVEGNKMFENFLFEICKLKPNFTMVSRKVAAIEEIRSTVGDQKVLCLVSGGVDSSVCAALLQAAIPADRIFALHVDLGFMRKDESRNVKLALDKIGLDLKVVDAAEEFANATTTIGDLTTDRLCSTLNPEHKRKIIGDTYMRVAEKEVRKLGLKAEEVFLAQGTLRPDLIESASTIASTNATVIKTHHNDTALVRQLRDQGRIIEPLKNYHKDEVRALGEDLGLPHPLVWRQPFPGPGLAIRIICADAPFTLPSDNDTINELKTYNTDKISTTLLPCRTVGVQGDSRSYSNLCALSCDGAPEWSELFQIAKAIPKKLHTVNRVIYAHGAKVPEERLLEITPTRLTKDVVKQLQEADSIVNEILLEYDLVAKLSQVPVVLFPVHFGEDGKRSVCIRTFITNDFMTGVPAIPGNQIPSEALNKMFTRILKEVDGIARVCYDLTAKPPATTEWE